MKYSKSIFNSTDWELLTQTLSTNHFYNLERFIKIYDQAFPEGKMSSPWISKLLRKSSKRKQHLYENIFKRKN